jgi:hypothetical protein
LRDLEDSVSQLSIGKATRDSDAIFVGAIDRNEWMALGRSLKRDGIVWLIVPKRSAAPAAVAFTTAARSAGFAPVKFATIRSPIPPHNSCDAARR